MTSDVLVFDFFGVICSEIAPFWLARYLPVDEAARVKATVVHAADIGELSQQDMFSQLGEIAHVSPKQVEEEWWSYVVIDRDVVEMIRKLKVDHTVALLTNAPAEFVRAILRKYELFPLFHAIVVSGEERCAKPDPIIYQRMLERLSVPAAQTVMIDDNPVNVKGAEAAGMNGLLFESSDQLRSFLVDRHYLSGC
ncbi:MAG TPA: HAD-IA family hydrolase [Symbiobacteriaceae bacterium]|nr:HAD-IA family hydrolase [Symbiobacteriaceae bacterium]